MDDRSDEPSLAPHRYPDWVMLDRRIRLGGCPEADHFHATHACAMSSEGETIHVSVCAVPSPLASRLLVSWPGNKHLSSEADGGDPPSFLFMAAHGSSILLRLRRDYRHRSELFVYTARSTGPPLLRLLPDLDPMSDTYSIYEINRFYDMFSRDSVGLLCDGDEGDFVVAELMIERKHYYQSHGNDTPLKAGLCVFRSCSPDNNWKVTWLWIHHKKGQHAKELNLLQWWSTHEVVSFGDSLCYVDYSQGILFVDVLSECPEVHYVRLPVKIPICRTEFSEQYRSLCVTDGGRTMKFVEVATTTISSGGAPAPALFTINVWRLRREGKCMTWEKESSMKGADLWNQQVYGDLPRVVPTFPRVSVEEPNLIYFVLSHKREVDDEEETWFVVVDMLNKTLKSSFGYPTDSGSLPTNPN